MRWQLVVTAGSVLAAALGCNPSVVQPDEALYRATLGASLTHPDRASPAQAREAWLGVPLSGPRWSSLNVFGDGPVLPAGTPVVLDGLERSAARGSFPREVGGGRLDRPLGTLYRVRFHTARGLCRKGCEANWRLPDDTRFVERFQAVFLPEDPLAALDPETRDLVAAHQVASWFDRWAVTLSVGRPNASVETLDGGAWVYERRFCQGEALVAVPTLLLHLEGEHPTRYERLAATDFYYPREPVDPRTGLCRLRTLDPVQLLMTPGNRDYLSRLEWQLSRRATYHRLIDQLEGGRVIRRPGAGVDISPGTHVRKK